MKLLNSIKKDFNTATFALIPLAIVINLAIGYLVSVLALPIFLDSIGTVLVAVICGPWAGLVTGLLSNVVGGILLDPFFFPFAPVAAVIGFVAGWLAVAGLFRSWWKVVLAGVIITVGVVIVAAPIRLIVFGGITPNSVGAITSLLVASGQSLISSVLTATTLSNVVDKVATTLVVFGILKGFPRRTLGRFPRSENVL